MKRQKKRIKRLFPRKYSAGYISLPSKLSSRLADNHETNMFTFRNRNVAARCLDPTPVTLNPELRVINRSGKIELGILHSMYQADRSQKPQPWHKGWSVEKTDDYDLTVWFSGNSYILVKETLAEPRKASRSIIYKGRNRVNQVLRQKHVKWKETISLGNSPPP